MTHLIYAYSLFPPGAILRVIYFHQLAMQFYVTFNCNFITTSSGNIGIWYVDDGTGTCVEWESQDEIVGGAQSMLTLSTIAGFAAGAMVLFQWLICEVCCAGCLEGLAFAASWILGSTVFMIYGE
jgi:hypothetical protein